MWLRGLRNSYSYTNFAYYAFFAFHLSLIYMQKAETGLE